MLLREEGKLELDDALGRHVPEAQYGELTLRRLLAHSSGIQREPPGEVWETLEFPKGAELLDRLARRGARPACRRALALLEPRVRAARRGRRPDRRDRVRGVRRRALDPADRAHPDDLAVGRARRPRLLRRPVREDAPTGTLARGRRRGGGRQPLEHADRSLPLGGASGLGRGDAPGADHGRPGQVDPRPRARPSARPSRRARVLRARRRDAGLPGHAARPARGRDRRGPGHERVDAGAGGRGDHGRARGEGARALPHGDEGVAAGDGAAPRGRRAARHLVDGGRSFHLLVGGRANCAPAPTETDKPRAVSVFEARGAGSLPCLRGPGARRATPRRSRRRRNASRSCTGRPTRSPGSRRPSPDL